MKYLVLVVGARRGLAKALKSGLSAAGYEVIEAEDGSEGWRRFRQSAPDLVFSDFTLPDADGITLLGKVRGASETAPFVMFSNQGEIEDVISALKSGADDFLVSEAGDISRRAVPLTRRLIRSPRGAGQVELERRLPGRSDSMVRVRERIAALAHLSDPVLISGEAGSGRQTAARALHRLAAARHPFVVWRAEELNKLPKPPRVGSVYVQNIERLAPELQRALLDELEAGQGGPKSLRWLVGAEPKLDLRADTLGFNGRLVRLLGRFEVCMPALREHPEDIPQLARALAETIGKRISRRVYLNDEALSRLREEPWSENVTGLKTVIEKLVAFSTQEEIGIHEVREVLGEVRTSVESIRDQEARGRRERLLSALKQTGGHITRTAELLGCSRAAVYRMAKREGIPLRRREL